MVFKSKSRWPEPVTSCGMHHWRAIKFNIYHDRKLKESTCTEYMRTCYFLPLCTSWCMKGHQNVATRLDIMICMPLNALVYGADLASCACAKKPFGFARRRTKCEHENDDGRKTLRISFSVAHVTIKPRRMHA
jgi:hypothetical protein